MLWLVHRVLLQCVAFRGSFEVSHQGFVVQIKKLVTRDSVHLWFNNTRIIRGEIWVYRKLCVSEIWIYSL